MTTPLTTRRLLTIVGSILFALLTLTGLASAKIIPFIEPLGGDWGGLDDPFVMDPGQYFSGSFGRLDTPDDLDAIALTFDAPVDAMLNSLMVPICGDHFVDFYPAVALIGPGLDRPDEDILADPSITPLPDSLADLLADLPDGMGALIFPYERPTPTLLAGKLKHGPRPAADWELYEGGHYADHTFTVDIPQAGEYLVAIWSPDGQTGAYTFMTGAIHPDPDVFPPDMDLDAVFQMINSGAWIGWDCETPAGNDAG
jgi:hypothetical protein